MTTKLLPRTGSLQVRSDGRPVKLKDSCQACGRSKVKCSREKPACKRCITHGWPCEYGASHRTGRISSKAYITPPPLKPRPAANEQQSAINTDLSQTGREDYGGASSTLAFGDFSSNTGLWSDMGDEDRMMTPSRGSDYDGEVDTLWSAYPGSLATNDAFVNRMFGPDPMSQLGPTANSQGFRPSEFDDFKFMSSSNSAKTSLTDGSDVLGYDEVASLGSRISNASESTTGTSCLMSALAIFKQLSTGQTCAISESTLSPSSSTVGTPGTVESVHNNGDNLAQKLQRILECRCSQDEYLASLVTLIVFKALAQRIVTRDSATGMKPGLDEVRRFQIVANMLVGRLRQIKSRGTDMGSINPGANDFQDNCMAGPVTNVMSAGCLPLPGFSNLAVEQLELELQNRLNMLAAASGRRQNDFGVFGSGVLLEN